VKCERERERAEGRKIQFAYALANRNCKLKRDISFQRRGGTIGNEQKIHIYIYIKAGRQLSLFMLKYNGKCVHKTLTTAAAATAAATATTTMPTRRM